MSTAVAEIVDIPEDAYHRDDIYARPSLSKSVIQILLTKSPAHAWAAHPKNPDCIPRADEKKFDAGTAAHNLFLEGRDDSIVIVDADAFRTNAAKAARDEAYAAGKTPLLTKDYAGVQAMAAAIRPQLDLIRADPPLFTDGRPEQTLVWEEDGVVCKARLDWLRDDYLAIDDLKTTTASAAPEAWPKTMLGFGGDLQMAMYLRGARAVLGITPEFRFVAVESSPPYALTPFSLAPDALAQADERIEYAIRMWRRCLASGDWPGYPRRVCYIQSPAWAENQWAEREYRDSGVAA